MTSPPDRPTVSVVMAVYNRAEYLPEALASIRWQTFTDWECVCVDDGSTDATAQILADFADADPRFRILRQENAGVATALARGDAAARGEWIARMDSDDVAMPERLERQLAYARQRPDCVGLGGAVLLTDPNGAPIGRSSYATDHEEIERRMLAGGGDTIAHPTLFYRRSAIEQIGTYRTEYEAAHDADFLIRLARAGRLANLPEVLLRYRQHPGNFCRVRHAEIRAQTADLVREAYAERGLPEPVELIASFRQPTRQSPLFGKWARLAARNGHHATAWRLWRQQAKSLPASFYTARVALEVAIRNTIATLSGKRAEDAICPDWREWDCRNQTEGQRRAA